MSAINIFGVILLIVFVLCGRQIMGLFPPKNRKDWLKIALYSTAVILSIIPLIFLDFQSA